MERELEKVLHFAAFSESAISILSLSQRFFASFFLFGTSFHM